MEGATKPLPLTGIRVLEFGHTILGPCCGMVLADLGAEVIKIEPPGGERTRKLKGFGTGYFAFFNRNKKSVTLDYKSAEGLATARALIATADVLIENMAPGALGRAGLGADDARTLNPQLIYCSLKGFLGGPYADRAALDEIVQMMSGLAYMTGPPGQPLRAGTSISDMLGGIFGALGILVALRERDRGHGGAVVESALFETAAFLMGQFMASAALTGEPVPPMPARVSAWAVYELFETADAQRVFIGITSDHHWQSFCDEFNRPDLRNDATLATNEMRVESRTRLIPELIALFKNLTAAEIERRCLAAGLPFAKIARPEDLFDDPQLNANGSLANTILPGGIATKLPKLPIRIDGNAFDLRSDPPPAGHDTRDILGHLPARNRS
ncbi:MAG TPA: CaiB/BaiF CoA-transferase family protein [Micropepsaceae bacterium]|jgi:crotonobetainyl-CoA:carnitine CoA-transferase CaiB-like acyl-CoA transferase|nr:CaiB/BaiF CoA-transferase family protein [Micropepsaceae bacterium]